MTMTTETQTNFDPRKRSLKGCLVVQQQVERLEVAGPEDKSLEATQQLIREGYRILRTGPYTDRKMYPKLDRTRFLIVAERIAKTKQFQG